MDTDELNKKQLSTLRHMLGINDPTVKIPTPWRNYAAVSPDDKEFKELHSLGLVKFDGHHGSYDYYSCTELGRLFAVKSHKDIRYKKSRRVYIKYLSVADANPDLTFKEFLTDPEFAKYRHEA
jgi:hypothetical protein